jgi:hypothetical protein
LSVGPDRRVCYHLCREFGARQTSRRLRDGRQFELFSNPVPEKAGNRLVMDTKEGGQVYEASRRPELNGKLNYVTFVVGGTRQPVL